MIEALSVGATTAIKLVAYVVVNLIAFISVLSFLDQTLSYFGERVNFPDLNFQVITNYYGGIMGTANMFVFYYALPPSKKRGYIALLMSVARSICRSVDQMVSADYLKYHLSQSLHILHVDWS